MTQMQGEGQHMSTTIDQVDQEVLTRLTVKGQTRFKTAIYGWQRDYGFAEIRGYSHIDATLREDGTYTVKYWDRNWSDNPGEFVVISEQILTKEKLLEDIKNRNDFIERTILRYEKQRYFNNVLSEVISS